MKQLEEDKSIIAKLPVQSVMLKLKIGELPADFFADTVARALNVEGPDLVLVLNLDKRVGLFAIARSDSKAAGLMRENSKLVPLHK